MESRITGVCLCGKVEFSIENDFRFLLFCHCEQCRRVSGSAHASNLFAPADAFAWEKGEDDVQRYQHPKRNFTKAFCRHCGSGLPFIFASGTMVLVPAGSINGKPNVDKKAQVFLCERTAWAPSAAETEKFEKFPDYF